MSFEAVNTTAKPAGASAVAGTIASKNSDATTEKKELLGAAPAIQTKLELGAPDDIYEKQADSIAEHVMRMPDQNFARQANTGGDRKEKIQKKESDQQIMSQTNHPDTRFVAQRKCAGCEMEEKEKIRRKILPVETYIQTKTNSNFSGDTKNISSSIKETRGKGAALDKAASTFMESRLSADFSDVKIHTGSSAVKMNKDLGAQAFTVGKDIYFNDGKYQPHTTEGKKLLAHELTHVLQQNGNNLTGKKAIESEKAIDVKDSNKELPKKDESEITTQIENRDGVSGKSVAEKNKTIAELGGVVDNEDVKNAEANSSPKSGKKEVKLLMPEAPETLSPTAQKRLDHAQHMTRVAANTHADIPTAQDSVDASREAVGESKEEANAKVGEQLVAALGEQPPPSPEIVTLCEKIKKVIHDKRPPDEDSLTSADLEKPAKEAGGEFNESVQADAQNVQQSYDSLNSNANGEPQKQSADPEIPPTTVETNNINASAAIPDPIPAQNISLDADVQSSEQDMEKAGLNKETAKLVDTGPIKDAREAHAELQETAANDPAQVKAAQQEALTKASADMSSLQASALHALVSSRSKSVTEVGAHEVNMKVTEEDKKKAKAKEAQDIIDGAKKGVNDLLNPLSRNALELWNAGVAIASKDFKDSLKRVQDWIDNRHSGVSGFFIGIKDYVAGLPDWVSEEYDKAEKKFGDDICALIINISTQVNIVIATCEKMIDNASVKIHDLYTNANGEIEAWAAEELKQFDGQIGSLKAKVASTRDQLNKDIASRASQSVQEVREQVHALREKAKGLIGRIADAIGEFLDDPVRFIINGLLSILGIPESAFWNVVHKIGEYISRIADDPIDFANKLIDAVGKGFDLFVDHFTDHLLKGMIDWLTKGLAGVGVELPKDLSVKSLITFLLQLMGISWPRIRKLIAKHIGEENTAHIEKAFEVIAQLVEQGPEGIFEMIKNQLDPKGLLDMIIEKIVSFVEGELVKQLLIQLALLFNPVGAILKAIEAIYDVLKWIFNNAARIFTLIETIVNSIGQILSGNISGVAVMVEKALGMLIAPIIDFFAELIHLDGLPDKVAGLIKGFQDWIEGILDKVIGWIAEKGKALLKKLGIGKEEPEKKERLGDEEVGKVVSFKAQKEQHRLWVSVRGSNVEIMVRSKEMPIDKKLSEWEASLDKIDEKKRATALRLIAEARNKYSITKSDAQLAKNAIDKSHKDASQDNVAKAKNEDNKTEKEEMELSEIMKQLFEIFGQHNEPIPTKVSYTLSDGRASSILAEPLSRLEGNTKGTPPSQHPLGWNTINPAAKNYWVRAHLLNENLHGPGLAWNLVPGTKETNNNMKAEIETPAKDEILKNDNNKQYYYEVHVTYYSGSHKEHYKYFPLNIQIKWGELIEDNGRLIRGKDRGRSFRQDVPVMDEVSAAAINESSAGKLSKASKGDDDNPRPKRENLEISESVFKKIIDKRRKMQGHLFSSVDQLVEEMDKAYSRPGFFKSNYENKLRALIREQYIFLNFPSR